MCAIVASRKENVKNLLTHNVKLSAKDDSTNDVLHLTFTMKSSEILKTLIQKDSSLNKNELNN